MVLGTRDLQKSLQAGRQAGSRSGGRSRVRSLGRKQPWFCRVIIADDPKRLGTTAAGGGDDGIIKENMKRK